MGNLPFQRLTAVALAIALSQQGKHEIGGNNRGPEVEAYLRAVDLAPGKPWCCAGLYWCFELAARQLGIPNPFPKTGSGLRLWNMADKECRDSNPASGRVYVLQHSAHSSHVGIVVTLDRVTGGVDEEISFNTNAAGSREGDRVAIHHGTPEVTHGGVLLGYLDFDRARQRKDSP